MTKEAAKVEIAFTESVMENLSTQMTTEQLNELTARYQAAKAVIAEDNTATDIEKYLAAKEEVSFKYNKVGAKIWYHAHAIIGTGAIDNGKFAGWSVDHDVKINRYEAALYLEKYGLTVEQFVAAEKEFYATRYPKDETTAEDNVEVEDTTADNTTVETETEDNTATGTEVAENKKARKPYSINPVIDEDSPVKFNHVDICIENDVLKISGLFECKNIETAYRRFRKIMAQVATEVPELKGWDEWEPAKKLTFDETEKIWLNENDEMIFDTKYTTNILNVNINEDTIYIWGTFYTTAEAYRAAHPEEPHFNYNTEATEAEQSTAQVEETDGSEEDDDESFSANVMPAEDDDTDDELIDPAEKITAQVEDEPALVDCAYKFNLENGVREFKIGKYAEEIDAREKNAVRAHEPREDVPNVEDNILLDPAKIVSETPEASTKIKKLFLRRKNHERKKTARHTQHRPRRMVHAARRH